MMERGSELDQKSRLDFRSSLGSGRERGLADPRTAAGNGDYQYNLKRKLVQINYLKPRRKNLIYKRFEYNISSPSMIAKYSGK